MEQINPARAERPAEQPAQEEAGLTRRDFFGLSWRVLTAFAAGQAACLGLRFLASRPVEGDFGAVIILGLLTDFPPGTITPFDQARLFLLRFEDGGFLALHSKCPHLACVVGWDEARNRFSCPCHGSEFERDGAVITAPAPRPLDRFPVLIDGDRVKVDTRQALRRTTTGPEDLVYASAAPEEALPASTRSERVPPGVHVPERD
ncbi:MAG: Rieske (2Fe-2S) protein [Anaerolineae bacterium]|nr:Rieske (2Fe-2S) protein [Anaerolineae bacterium]